MTTQDEIEKARKHIAKALCDSPADVGEMVDLRTICDQAALLAAIREVAANIVEDVTVEVPGLALSVFLSSTQIDAAVIYLLAEARKRLEEQK